MTAESLLDSLETLADAPGGIDHLRELVLHLAVRGRLVAQRPTDEPADALLEQLEAGRARMIEEGEINKPRHPIGEPIRVAPFRIPDSWAWLRIGDVGAVVGGGTPKKDALFWADGHEIPWLTPADMRGQDSRYVFRGARDITLAGQRASSAQLLPAGSVLFSSRAPIGHVGIAAQALTTNQGFKSCVPYASELTEYIYLYLREAGPAINAAASGTTFKEVSGKEVALVPIPVPPVAEQHRIVARVDELMALLDGLEVAKEARDATRAQFRDAALATLQDANDAEEVKTAWSRIADHMHDLFTDPTDIQSLRETIRQLAVRGRLVGQDPSDEPATGILELADVRRTEWEQDKRIRKQKGVAPLAAGLVPFPAPHGWTWCRIDDAFYVSGGLQKSGKRRPVKNSFPYLRVANVQRGRLELDELAEFELFDGELEKLRLEAGDLLVVEGNGSRSEIGRCARWAGEVENCVHQNHLIRCRPLQPEIEEFVLLFLNSPTGTETMASLAVTTSGLYNLSVGKIRAIPIPLPPIAEQRRIIAKARQLMTLLDRLEASLSDVRATQEAFSASAARALPEQGVEVPEESAVTVG